MAQNISDSSAKLPPWQEVSADWAADKQTFDMHWGKIMMWIFLLSDTFVFSIFLTGYMNVRISTTEVWPNASEVFALTIAGQSLPLLLIAIMTFILISSSGSMAMAVNYGYQGKRDQAVKLMFITAILGASFVGMQAFEWSKLIIDDGVRPWSNPMGAEQFGACFFMITGFHGLHVTGGVILLVVFALKVRRGEYEEKGYGIIEIVGLYWHFVDLVWVFIFALFYLW